MISQHLHVCFETAMARSNRVQFWSLELLPHLFRFLISVKMNAGEWILYLSRRAVQGSFGSKWGRKWYWLWLSMWSQFGLLPTFRAPESSVKCQILSDGEVQHSQHIWLRSKCPSSQRYNVAHFAWRLSLVNQIPLRALANTQQSFASCLAAIFICFYDLKILDSTARLAKDSRSHSSLWSVLRWFTWIDEGAIAAIPSEFAAAEFDESGTDNHHSVFRGLNTFANSHCWAHPASSFRLWRWNFLMISMKFTIIS